MTWLLTYWKQALAIAAMLVAFGAGWSVRDTAAERDALELEVKHKAAIIDAEQAARTEERRRFESVAQTGVQGDEDLQDIRDRAAASDAESDRLRQRLDQVTRYYRADNSRLATEWATATETIRVLTGLLAEYDGFAGPVAGAYEDARARGLTCERAWDAIRGETDGGAHGR